MKTILSIATPAEVETECLVAVVLDRSVEKDKPEVTVETGDAAVKEAAREVILSGEATGKALEVTLLHHPGKLKAKRLLLVGGGKGKNFSHPELRKLAGAAARTLKGRGLRSFAFVTPSGIGAADATRAIVEGACVGNFDPDYYKSDRKDQKIDELTVVTGGDVTGVQQAMDEARIVGESQNFTRDLVNEPSNRMTPTILAERAKKMAQEVGLKCEVYVGQDQGNENGRVLERGPGLGRAASPDCPAL